MLDGIKISGFRSIGPEGVILDDLEKINVIAGPNNCGKSNILRFIRRIAEKGFESRFDENLDCNLHSPTKRIEVGIRIKKTGFSSETWNDYAHFLSIERTTPIHPKIEDLWLHYHVHPKKGPTDASIKELADVLDVLDHNRLCKICGELTGEYYTHDKYANAKKISVKCHDRGTIKLNVYFIDAFRKISDREGDRLTGSGLIKELRQLQSPTIEKYETSKQRFIDIQNFVRTITGNEELTIEIPVEKDVIYVIDDGKILPLESLGSGIHQLVILAAAVTVRDNVVFCIEEPEVHLHQSLQKKFITYISNRTNNQYFITTHSNAFLDYENTRIFRCYLEGHNTKCISINTDWDKYFVLKDLGYSPSDLLLSNFIIWVEGPSDRIYIRAWIEHMNPGLRENIHYTIMFYGGRLLSHLSYDSPEIRDFIDLSKINKASCVVIDSDREKANDRIGKTKNRIKNEFEKSESLAWITKGRTIENYIGEEILNSSIREIHPKTYKTLRWGQYKDLTKIKNGKTIDKVAVAKVACKKIDLDILDLTKMIKTLTLGIQKANGL